MSVQYSTAVRNAMLDAIESTIGTSARLKFFTGAVPANCAAADPAGLVATIVCPSDWMAAASGGTKVLAGSWSVAASGSGTAISYRIYDSGSAVCHEQGTVGTSGTDIVLDNNVMAAAQVVTITAKTITAGNA
jgi:hypothetical protein